MKTRIKLGLWAVAILILMVACYWYVSYQMELVKDRNYSVVLAYNIKELAKNGSILEAYRSVLEEEGVPFYEVDFAKLTTLDPKSVKDNSPLVILPDGIVTTISEEAENWLKIYLENGGNLAVIYDACIRDLKGAFKERVALSDYLGINYIRYQELKERCYSKGVVRFVDERSRNFFEIPPGKTNKNGTLSGYGYETAEYPLARTELVGTVPADEIYALGQTEDGESYPMVVIHRLPLGKILYVNLPLGYLKINGDDLPLRAVLRTFLFKVLEVPHLVNIPDNKPALVLTCHIDDKNDWNGLSYLLSKNLIRKSIRFSFHVTAGNFRDKPDDLLGFDACGEGKKYLEVLKGYGSWGSQGGWAYNWFSQRLRENRMDMEQMKDLMKKNQACVATVAGGPIDEYSSPLGFHLQPQMTLALESLGMNSYVYTGDSGSVPNRTFAKGKMVSEKVLAFPQLPYERYASLFEMKNSGVPGSEVETWLKSTIDFIMAHKTIRLLSFHIYDIYEYSTEFSHFLDDLEKRQSEGGLAITSMGSYTRSFLRMLKTKKRFSWEKSGLSLALQNEDGLRGITIAVPKSRFHVSPSQGIELREEQGLYLVTLLNNDHETRLLFGKQN